MKEGDTIESVAADLVANLDRMPFEEWARLPPSIQSAHIRFRDLKERALG